MKTSISYRLVLSLLGNNPNSYSPETFNSIEEASNFWEINYKNRCKNDSFDEYWRKIPLRIQQVIENNLWND